MKFIKNKDKKIYLFSHNYLINNWKNILLNQLNLIKKSGLYNNISEFYLHCFGDDNEFEIFSDIIKNYDINNKLKIIRHEDNFYEYYPLQHLYDFSVNNNDDCYILYFHLKGVWSSHNLQTNGEEDIDLSIPIKNLHAINAWRDCMEYFNIERWYNCIDKLNTHDVVGCLYNYNINEPLFTGNFWWANSYYIRKLNKLTYQINFEKYPNKIWKRIKCEKWINTINNNYYNFFTPSDYGLYMVAISKEEYRDDINPKFSILTSNYQRYDKLKRSIQSVIDQTYKNYEMLICSDGYDQITEKLVESFNDNRIIYHYTEKTNDYGSTQKNYLTKNSNGKYLIYLDDDNLIYPHCLNTIKNNMDDSVGMLIYKIDYDGLDHPLPDENKIEIGKIDTLNICVDRYYTKYAIWKNYVGQDYEFIKICENNVLNHDKNIKFISNIIARHTNDNINKNIVVFHHNLLIQNWIDVIEEQIFLMKKSELYQSCSEIYATVLHIDDNEMIKFKEIINKEDYLNKWNIIELKENKYEYDCLKLIQNYSKVNDNTYICYFHTKGVGSRQLWETNIGLTYWRKFLNHFIITEYKKCIDFLIINDVVGVSKYKYQDNYMFSGNFFWTKSEYIKTLPELTFNDDRYFYEKWLLMNKFNVSFSIFDTKEIDYEPVLYLKHLPLLKYRKDYDNILTELEWGLDKYNSDKKDNLKNIFSYILKSKLEKKNALEVGFYSLDISYCISHLFEMNYIVGEKSIQWSEFKKDYSNYILIKDDNKSFINSLKFDAIFLNNDYYDDDFLKKIFIQTKIICGFDFNLLEKIKKLFNIEYIKFDNSWIVKTGYKISIIIPTYNRTNILKECINSVLKQNYNNLEIIICHDGPSEKFNEFIDKNKLDNVFYYNTELHNNNLGSSQRNSMLNIVTGDYVLFLDDDNILYDNYLNKMVNEIDEKTGMIVCRIHFNDKEWHNLILPIDDKLNPLNIDHLSILFNINVAKQFEWDNFWGQDHRYISKCEKYCMDNNLEIKYIKDVLAKHRYLNNKINSPSIYIISSHPNYKISEDMTIKTIEKIKCFGEKVILSAHCPVSPDIQKLVDYFIYDKNNPLIKHDFFTQSWFNTNDYYALLNITKNDNNFNHALGVFLNYYNSMILAKSQGYKIAVCTNFDMVFSEQDKNIIEDKINEMVLYNKRAFFMNTPEREGIHYKTIFFITEIDWFLNTFKYLENNEIYMEEIKKVNSNTNCLENFFYHTLKSQSHNILLQEINENELFPNSQINLFSLIEYNTILPVENEPDNFVFWFSSANSLDNRKIDISVLKNNNTIYKFSDFITQSFIFYKKVKFTRNDIFKIITTISDNNEILKEKIIEVNNEIFDNILSYGNFIDKININSI